MINQTQLDSGKLARALFWSVLLAHLTHDLFANMGPVLLVFMGATVLPMTAAQLGLAVSAKELLGALTQPLFGLRADRTDGRWLSSGGVAWSVLALLASLAVAPLGNYWLTFVPFALSGLGGGAFHPIGAKYIAESDRSREASNMAYFFLFGQLGLALGPLMAGLLLGNVSGPMSVFARAANPFAPIFVLSIVSVPGVVWMWLAVRTSRPKAAVPEAVAEGTAATARPRREALGLAPLLLIIVVVTARSVAHAASAAFIPALFEQKGWSPSEYGLISSTFWFATAAGAVIFGQFADRFDRRYVIAASLLLAAPTLFLLPLADGPLAYALALAVGLLSGGSFSLFVVVAQNAIPSGRGFASGAAIGYQFVAGAVGILLMGILADGSAHVLDATFTLGRGIGLEAIYPVLAGIALASGILSFLMPARLATGRRAQGNV